MASVPAAERDARSATRRPAAKNRSGVMAGRPWDSLALSLASVLLETCIDASGGRVEPRGAS